MEKFMFGFTIKQQTGTGRQTELNLDWQPDVGLIALFIKKTKTRINVYIMNTDDEWLHKFRDVFVMFNTYVREKFGLRNDTNEKEPDIYALAALPMEKFEYYQCMDLATKMGKTAFRVMNCLKGLGETKPFFEKTRKMLGE